MEYTPAEEDARETVIQASLAWVKEMDENEGDITSMLFTTHHAVIRAVNILKKVMNDRRVALGSYKPARNFR